MAAIALGPSLLTGAGKQPKKTDGGYTVTVSGYYEGSGTADVSPGGIHINADVVVAGSGGRKLNLVAPNLTLDGDHFSGTANVQGNKLNVRGRLDGYAGDPDFHGARLLLTYTDSSGHSGRIAGTLP
ncbi:MAG TPA: hypothetical protein VL371_15305 [Gemmataceae bacterium]|nr:hypothetical protein [Gemmataceae bacterium]